MKCWTEIKICNITYGHLVFYRSEIDKEY